MNKLGWEISSKAEEEDTAADLAEVVLAEGLVEIHEVLAEEIEEDTAEEVKEGLRCMKLRAANAENLAKYRSDLREANLCIAATALEGMRGVLAEIIITPEILIDL